MALLSMTILVTPRMPSSTAMGCGSWVAASPSNGLVAPAAAVVLALALVMSASSAASRVTGPVIAPWPVIAVTVMIVATTVTAVIAMIVATIAIAVTAVAMIAVMIGMSVIVNAIVVLVPVLAPAAQLVPEAPCVLAAQSGKFFFNF